MKALKDYWRYRASDEEPDQGLITVSFPWQQYTAVVAALRRRGGPNLDLLGSAGAIPDSALRAVRCALYSFTGVSLSQ